MGIGRPDGPPFTLNVAVDALMKREFDVYRAHGEPHPVMVVNGIEALPLIHPDIEDWRDPWKGLSFTDKRSGFLVYGAVDDVWINNHKELHIVDYKATSAAATPTLEAEYRAPYKRQVEIYQWLFRKNGFCVSDIAYFVFANGDKSRGSFDGALHFHMSVLEHRGGSAWVDDALESAVLCLRRDEPPPGADDCSWCAYVRHASAQKA